MYMPDDLSKLIYEFARPLTRPNWRSGGSFPSFLFYSGLMANPRLHPLLFYQTEFDWLVYQGNFAENAEEFEFYLQGFDMY